MTPDSELRRELETVVRRDSGRMLATLISLLGDFDLAEDALQEAIAQALVSWRSQGLPAQPRNWLISTARFKAIDRLRRDANFRRKRAELAIEEPASVDAQEPDPRERFPDERLKLLFTCCHPALATETQVALALRTLCGLSSDEIARAFLIPPATLQQRLVRAKAKIRKARIPYRVPEDGEIPQRLDAVLRIVYLIFNEGYASTAGETLVRADLCQEAIRLARILVAFLPGRSQALGLLALMLLHHARQRTRVDATGDLVRLSEQDRSQWDAKAISEGLALTAEAFRTDQAPGSFAIQAAIAAVHARAENAAATDWAEIAGLYDELLRREPSPVVALNRAVAVGEAYGAERGLALLERLRESGALAGFHLLPAARAEFLLRLDRREEALEAFTAALGLVGNEPERRFLLRRAELAARAPVPG